MAAEYDEDVPANQFRHLEYPPSIIDRYTVLLKDGETTATIYPIHSPTDLPPGLLAFLCDEFNMEIERGDTSPFFDTLDMNQFQQYWFGSFGAVMILGDAPALEGPRQWEKECLGTFLVKPNYPGRCSHICTGSFLVNAGIRGKGIGRTLTDCFLQWAPRLGYTYTIFNLVFETNVPARRIWELFNFKRIGRIKLAGILKGHEQAVDAIMYGRELITNSDPAVGAYRFDKIKFYLETGRYPAMADRQEKSRLRLLALHYRLENGKLMLKGREVILDPERQLQICTDVHMTNHGGINKTTSVVAEKYHWTRIKDTVAAAIKNCPECRDIGKDPQIVKRQPPRKPTSHPLSRKGIKMLLTQPNNPNARHMLRRRDDVDMSLPGNEALLSHDLLGLDDNIMAAVEAAQRSHHNGQNSNSHPSYAAAAASAVSGDSDYHQYLHDYLAEYQPDGRQEKDRNSNIPVDPEVSAFDHVDSGGDEIEIARALIQANEDVPEKREGWD